MSGGHWNYAGSRLREELTTIGEDPDVRTRWPFLAEALIELGNVLYAIEHDIDWDLSGDHKIPHDGNFEAVALAMLEPAV